MVAGLFFFVLLLSQVQAVQDTLVEATKAIHDEKDDILLFGPETRGLPAGIRGSPAVTEVVRIPMSPNNRSLNLSNSVAIVLYEAWRQLKFSGSRY